MQFRTTAGGLSALHEHLRVSRSHHRPQDAFFLRAESFFNVASAIDDYGSAGFYGGSLHQRSHGESFIDLAVNKFGPESLFLLDEPEAALSIHGQLQFLVRLHDLVEAGSQFVIATHSPLLMAFPNALIYEFTDEGPGAVSWNGLDAVQILGDFLAHPDDFLRELLTDDE
jgi:predicted ATPase